MSYTSAGLKIIKLIATLDQQCSDDHAQYIYVAPKPTTSSISGPSISKKEIETYSVTNKPNTTYTWSVVGGTIIGGQGSNAISIKWTIRPNTATIKVSEESEYGCKSSEKTKTVNTTFGVGINDIVNELNISLWPNPSNGLVHLKFDQPQLDVVVRIMSIQGEVLDIVTSSNSTALDINMPYSKGMYQLVIETKKGRSIQSVILQ